jgi:hypothetical protein
MKTSIKTSVFTIALLSLITLAEAQTTTTTTGSDSATGPILSVGVEGGFSAGSFKNTYKWYEGGSLQIDIPVAQMFFFTANAAYLNFNGKGNIGGSGIDAPDIHLLPVKAGLKYFPIGVLYLQADAGAAFALNKSDVGYNKTASFIYTPQIGVQLPLGGKSYIDAAALYEASTKFVTGEDNSKVNFFGLRLAYAFSVKEKRPA